MHRKLFSVKRLPFRVKFPARANQKKENLLKIYDFLDVFFNMFISRKTGKKRIYKAMTNLKCFF